MPKIVSAVIAFVLLGLYAYAVSIIYGAPTDQPSEPVITILSLVGGLVSALVVAVLAITPARANPAVVLLAPMGPTAEKIVTILTGAYLLAWLVCGVALLVKWMQVPDATKVLSAAATSWLGLAVAAAYSYFGLKPLKG